MEKWVPFHHSDFSFNNAVDILDYIRHRTVKFNESWDIKVIAKKGKGKSTIAIAAAMRLDPNFDVNENIAFTATEWLEKSSKLGRGAAIVMDEMGTQRFASSHKWQSADNQDFSDTVQLNRTDGQIYIATTLDTMRLTNRVRETFPVFIYPEKKIVVKRPFFNSETGKTEIKSYLAIRCILRIAKEDLFFQNGGREMWSYPRYAPGGIIKRIILYHPPVEVFNQYSKRRDNLKTEVRETFVERQKSRLAVEKAGGRAADGGGSGVSPATSRVNARLNKRMIERVVQKKVNKGA